jgi:Flp pilus assembly protein TadD
VVLFAELAARRPDDVVAAADLASALDAAGRTDEARIVWTGLLPRAKLRGDVAQATSAAARLAGLDDPGAEDAERDRWMMQEGLDALYAARAPERAIGVFRQVLALHPAHYGATYQLAVALERAGRGDEAKGVWAEVVRLAERYGDPATAEMARRKTGEIEERRLTPR